MKLQPATSQAYQLTLHRICLDCAKTKGFILQGIMFLTVSWLSTVTSWTNFLVVTVKLPGNQQRLQEVSQGILRKS